jgi:peptide/nickel transport system ATP-binding protein
VTRPLLCLRELVVEFPGPHGPVRAVDGLDLDVLPGEVLGVVGRSGAGKTVALLAALRLLPPSTIVTGTALFDGEDLLRMAPARLRALRGRQIGMVFQDPMTSLHPSYRVVDQVAEAVAVHDPGARARDRALELLHRVGVPRPERRVNDYPHQWSGGMRQRAVIAMAVAHRPRLLVADEPTTALDVTIQAQILELLRSIRAEVGAATVLVTHDLGVVAETADRVAVVASGRVVETAPVSALFQAPEHPETVALLGPVRARQEDPPAPPTARGAVVLEARDLVMHHRTREGHVHAVDGVSFALRGGETLALVGESGCGKTSLARTLLRLHEPTAGSVLFEGQDVSRSRGRRLTLLRRGTSMVFQDPYASLNPRRTVGAIVAEPLRIAGTWRRRTGPARVAELLEMVGLEASCTHRRPDQFSGGQRQRIAIARALALEPRALVLDEPLSSLDVATSMLVVDLLQRLQRELGLAYLLISHDLALVRRIAHRVAVMYLGRVVETAPAADLYRSPRHPYTRALLSAVPRDPWAAAEGVARIRLLGDPPDPLSPPAACRFHPRCWKAADRCTVVDPELAPLGTAVVACHLPELLPVAREVHVR